jgi:hypothetical protein
MSHPAPPPLAKQPQWMPRMWEGCDFFAWLELLRRHRFAVQPRYWYIAVIVTCVSFVNTVLRLIQDVIYGPALRKVEMAQAPIFILGHWRTGTTLLHELMICDDRVAYPTTIECAMPNHFLLTENFFLRWLWFLMPSTRPMDNMKAGLERPQEDEFAMCMFGVGSPYLMIAFPNHPPEGQEYLDLENVAPENLRRWKVALRQFLTRLTYKSGKRLVLKSPPHTARVKTLREMYPDAIFIHIVRDPFVVYPSTVNLWRTLYRTHGLQAPTCAGLEDYVLSTFVRMYERWDEARQQLDPGQYYELHYEDLIKDPVGEMRKIYDHFELGGYDEYLPRLETYLASVKGYETNKYQLSEAERARIMKQWGPIMERYGYAPKQETLQPIAV